MGPDVWGHGDPAPPPVQLLLGGALSAQRLSELTLCTLSLPDASAAAPCPAAPAIPGPRKVAGDDILGAAGGMGHRAIWKFPGLREHLCNRFRGGVWMMD